MRLFVAVDVGDELKEKISSLMEKFKTDQVDINLVETPKLHFTIKFLGEVEENRIQEIGNKITESLWGIKPFEVELIGVGFFGTEKFIKVIWIGVGKGKEGIINLCEKINKNLEFIRKEDFAPSPHLTIGRVVSGRNREELLRIIKHSEKTNFGKMVVKEIKLKQSILKRGGPVYSDVESFSL